MEPGSRKKRFAAGCVSFLNARPLVDGLDDHPALDLRYDVPSGLLEDLLQREVDIALCPVVDYQLSDQPLTVVPVGGIGSEGTTLTVRLFSRVPMEAIREVHADTDSHTSVVLTRLVLHDLYRITPAIRKLDEPRYGPQTREAETLLLIGDKVVRNAPSEGDYPHQLDLGEAWKELTGLPFVFAVWMSRRGEDLGEIPAILDRQRKLNSRRIDRIASDHAAAAGFPLEIAKRYLGELLRYGVGPRELEAIRRFWARAFELSLLPRHRPLELYPNAPILTVV